MALWFFKRLSTITRKEIGFINDEGDEFTLLAHLVIFDNASHSLSVMRGFPAYAGGSPIELVTLQRHQFVSWQRHLLNFLEEHQLVFLSKVGHKSIGSTMPLNAMVYPEK